LAESALALSPTKTKDAILLTRQQNISSVVIPANAGIQTGQWMPDQVRHDVFAYLITGLILTIYNAIDKYNSYIN
jgi:hypothetical protein